MFAFFDVAKSIELSRFTLTLFSLLPPPTDKINIVSLWFNLLPISQVSNTISHPSSLVLAVNSETLSVGAYERLYSTYFSKVINHMRGI